MTHDMMILSVCISFFYIPLSPFIPPHSPQEHFTFSRYRLFESFSPTYPLKYLQFTQPPFSLG